VAYGPDPTMACTTFDCAIANLRLVVSLQHPRAELPAPHRGAESGRRPFAGCWAERGNTVTDIVVDRGALTASALARFAPPPPWTPRQSDLVVDAFVVALEVGQILLYELDRLDRADSNTLWMRQTELQWTSHGSAPIPAEATITIVNPRVLNRGTERWRTADIRGDVYGITARCAIAHRLP